MLVDSNDRPAHSELVLRHGYWHPWLHCRQHLRRMGGSTSPRSGALVNPLHAHCAVYASCAPLPTQHLNAESVPYQQSGPCPAGPGGRAPSKNSFRRLTPRNHALLPTPAPLLPDTMATLSISRRQATPISNVPGTKTVKVASQHWPLPTPSGPLLTLSSRQHYCERSAASNAAHGVRCWAPGWHAALHRAGGVDVAVHPHRT